VRGDGLLLRWVRLQWWENGQDPGMIRKSEGHATLQPVCSDSSIAIEVEYQGRTQKQTLAVEQTTWVFTYDPCIKRHRRPAPPPRLLLASTAPRSSSL
jgi:hypothetical protein